MILAREHAGHRPAARGLRGRLADSRGGAARAVRDPGAPAAPTTSGSTSCPSKMRSGSSRRRRPGGARAPRCRSSACRSRSRTISTWPAIRPPPGARPSRTSRRATATVVRAPAGGAGRSWWARRTWTSSRPASPAPGRRTARCRPCSIRTTSRAARAPGSAVAVAARLVAFALGTDTAGSGRVPAAFNGIVGLKPTRGLLSTAGVMPACRSLDCVSVLAHTVEDAARVLDVARGPDAADPYSREPGAGSGRARRGLPLRRARGRPARVLRRRGGGAPLRAGARAARGARGRRVTIDLAPFRAAADLLYAGPWVAERLAALGPFFDAHPEDIHPVVRAIVGRASTMTAVDVFAGMYRLEDLRRQAGAQWAGMDVLALPTTGTMYRHAAVEGDPVRLNSNLGYYTNFVNLLDCCALAVPAGLRPSGLPFGISLIAPAFHDERLCRPRHDVAARAGCARERARGAGAPGGRAARAAGGGRRASDRPAAQPGARRTAAGDSCAPPAPRRCIVSTRWPAPGRGSPGWCGWTAEPGRPSRSRCGSWGRPRSGASWPRFRRRSRSARSCWRTATAVKGFLCEAHAVAGADDISRYGGWRAYLAGRERRDG